MDEFFLAATDSDHDVIVITETWLNEDFIPQLLFGDRFTVYRKDRNAELTGKKRGGGVLIAVSNHLKSSSVALTMHMELEQLWVRVTTASSNAYIGVIYISPEQAMDSSNIEKHIECVSHVTDRSGPRDSILLLGDFNQPGLVWKTDFNDYFYPDPSESTFSRSSSALIDGMSLFNMKQLNPVVNHMNRKLDLVYCNEQSARQCNVTEAVEPLVEIDAFHPALLVSFKCPRIVSFVESAVVPQLNFRKTDFTALNHALLETDWTALHAADNVNEAVRILTNTLTELFRVYVPSHEAARSPPWSNSGLRILKRERARYLRLYSANRNPPNGSFR